MHMIEASGITKRFDSETVLRGIDLNVDPGEILGVLGPSGSGKTTLVKCLIGAIGLNQGHIEIKGTRIPNLKLMDSIGYMAQQDALYEDLSGLQNIVFFGQLKGLSKAEARAQAHALLDLVDLSKDKNKKAAHYSGGMKRRLSLSAALIGNPDVIVLDEPTVGIDPVLRELFWAEFQRLKSLGKVIIVTTHVMDEADKCDRLILLREGKVIQNGSPQMIKALTRRGTIESAFIQATAAESKGGEKS